MRSGRQLSSRAQARFVSSRIGFDTIASFQSRTRKTAPHTAICRDKTGIPGSASIPTRVGAGLSGGRCEFGRAVDFSLWMAALTTRKTRVLPMTSEC